MVEHAADFEWRGEGEEAEVAVYAPDAATAERALERTLPAARLPGAESPVEAAASREGFGSVAVSGTHASPDLFSAPRWGLLVVAELPVSSMGTEQQEVTRLLSRRLSEVALPGIGEAGVRELSESGAAWAAGEGLIEEEDLSFFVSGGSASHTGDSDPLGRRALAAGARDWTRPGRVGAFGVADVLDSHKAGELGLEEGALALVVDVGAEDLGRLALAGHRERIVKRIIHGEFGSPEGLLAAPVDTEEAADLLSATGGAAGYAAGRAALVLYALRRALGDLTPLRLRAAWPVGGLEGSGGRHVHRDALAAMGEGGLFVSGLRLASGTGRMSGSAPPFGVPEGPGGWPWEEAGVCTGVAVLESLGGRSEVKPWTS